MQAEVAQESGAPAWTRRKIETPYQKWQKAEGIPVHKGSAVPDLYTAEVGFWDRVGQKAALVNLAGQEQDDGWIIEIAPRRETKVLHHVFEAMILVLEGRGATTFWQSSTQKQTVEWQRGSLFAPPLNCYYQHFNLDGDQPARLWAVTAAPMFLNMVRDQRFIFDNPFIFDDRYKGEDDFFTNPGHKDGNQWRTNFVPNVRTFEMEAARTGPSTRGLGVQSVQFVLGNNSMQCHISQWPSGTYKKAHCHGVGAHVTILNGQGYTLLWSEGEPYTRVDWKEGTVLSPRDGEYHQHFNTGTGPCSFLALRLGDLDWNKGGPRLRYKQEYRQDSEDFDGGIPYELEDPDIYDTWLKECQASGVTPQLARPGYVS